MCFSCDKYGLPLILVDPFLYHFLSQHHPCQTHTTYLFLPRWCLTQSVHQQEPSLFTYELPLTKTLSLQCWEKRSDNIRGVWWHLCPLFVYHAMYLAVCFLNNCPPDLKPACCHSRQGEMAFKDNLALKPFRLCCEQVPVHFEAVIGNAFVFLCSVLHQSIISQCSLSYKWAPLSFSCMMALNRNTPVAV